MPFSASSQDITSSIVQLLKLNPCQHYWVGYSGGVDSTVLLHALSQMPISLSAIHVHHGLSDHADDWARHCQRVCDELNVPLMIERVEVDLQDGGLEQAARSARQSVFKRFIRPNEGLLLGHHKDDQVETFMMRLMRGSGLTGLTVMDEQRDFYSGKLMRPLLECSREDIEAYAQANALSWIEDESNLDTDLDRNWWRQIQLPAIYARYPQAAQSILKTVSVLQDEHRLLTELIQPIYEGVIDDKRRLDINKLSRQNSNLQGQLIRKWLEDTLHYPLLSDKHIRILLKDFLNSRDDAEPVFRWADNEIRRHTGKLYIMKQLPALPNHIQPLPLEGEVRLSLGRLKVAAGKGLKPSDYVIGVYDGTLKAKPVGRPTKVLKKWFQEFSIPPWQRAYWPIVLKGEQVVAVPGLFICEGVVSENGLAIDYEPY